MRTTKRLWRALLAVVPAVLAAQTTPLPPALATGNVAIPLAEYNRMVDEATSKASAPARRTDVPPQPYALESATLNLRVGKDSVRGSVALHGEVLRKGITPVALASGFTLLDARLQGGAAAPLPLFQKAGVHSAYLEGPAEFDIQLDTSLALTAESGRAGFTIPRVSAGSVRLTLTVPGEQTAVNISSGVITASTSASGRTTVEATLAPGKSAVVWWSARNASPAQAAAAPVKELRYLSDVKTLISVGESEIVLTALADITVLQGEGPAFELIVPDGYEVTNATGASLIESDARNGRVTLRVANATIRSHQFLVAMAKPVVSASGNKADVVLPSVSGTQRETGELLVEGQGALELAVREAGGLRRMDLREASAPLLALADHSIQSAFRYQRRIATAAGAGSPPGVALEWVRFAGQPLVPAVAERATVTTLVTREGRSLTEVRLTVSNQSQPFARVALPAGATVLTAEVSGEKVKPVEAADGSRVPLLRPGFRPTLPYAVSFVYSHAGAPFAKKGSGELVLPKLDLPVKVIEWEVLLPSDLRVAAFGGDAVAARLLAWSGEGEAQPPIAAVVASGRLPVGPGEVGGNVIDAAGGVVPGTTVSVTHASGRRFAVSNAEGYWRVPALPEGPVEITVNHPGFKTMRRTFNRASGEPLLVTLTLEVGSVAESVEVSASTSTVTSRESRENERLRRQAEAAQERAASSNVMDLQKRLAGVLPVAVTIPRSGNAYRFVRPLVIDEETRLTFQYRQGR